MAGVAQPHERELSLAQSPAADPDRGAVFSEAEPAQNMLSIMRRRRPALVRERRFDQPRRAVIQQTTKLIQTGAEVIELYDLASDPRETVNLADIFPERSEELQTLLTSFLRTSAVAPPQRRMAEMDDPVVQRRLRELGYLE